MAEAAIRRRNEEDRAVAIVGLAGVLPGAADMDTFWANVVAGVDATTDVPDGRWDPVFFDPTSEGPARFYCRRGGFVDDVAGFDPTEFGIMPLAVDGVEPDQLLALVTAARALADAGDPHRRTHPSRVGVILGRGGYVGRSMRRLEQRVHTAEQLVVSLRSLIPDLDEERIQAVRAEFLDRLGPSRPESAIDVVPNLAASRISNRLDLRGPSHTVDAACASSLIAVEQAVDQLASGRCDVVLAGGVHHCHDLTLWSVFTQLGAVSRTQQLRAFDRCADGLLIGEATVMLVLKRLADAEAAGERVYAVIRGTGIASDGRVASLMSPSVDGQVLALEAAWRESGRDPAAVGLIEAHGTGTPTGDEAELRTLARFFGPPSREGSRAGLGSAKSMIGHAMPAAGAVGLARAALSIYHGQVPPTLHVEEPHPLVEATRFRLVGRTEPWDGSGPRLAGVNAFGFGGINAHVVLEEHPDSTGRPSGRRRRRWTDRLEEVGSDGTGPAARPGTIPMVAPGSKVLGIAGIDQAEVLARLGTAGTEGTHGEGPCRLAVIDPDPKRLALAKAVVERGRPFGGRNDVWFQPAPLLGGGTDLGGGRRGELAFLFPGLEPDFAPRVDDVAALVGFDSRRIVGGANSIEILGPAVIDAGRLLYAALDRMGVHPDMCGGHSVGEWTAQVVTGMTPAGALEPLVDELKPGRLRHPDVAFVALGCSVEMSAEMIADLPGAVVSHDNCPHQSVVCAPDGTVDEIRRRAQQRRVFAQEMPFRSGFHTPMFAPYIDGMRRLFGSLPIQAPSVPVWSATAGAPYPSDPDQVRALTVEHLTRPVEFQRLVNRLYDHGARVFVEVGVGSLVGFVDDILGDRPHLAVPANSAKRSGLAQLQRVAAALWCAGAELGRAARTARLEAPPTVAVRPAARALQLGTELVRGLTPLVAVKPAAPEPQSEAAVAEVPVAGGVLMGAFQATIGAAAEASREVVELWADRAVPASPTGAARPAPTGPPPETELAYPETFSLSGQPAWGDHAIFPQAPGWQDQRDRFPIVPLTAMIERFGELATELCPNLVPVGLEDIRAMRWLVVEPATTTTVRASIVGGAETGDPPGTVRVRTVIEGHARATVVMAGRYPPTPEPRPRPERARRLPYPPGSIYSDGWLFHGPAYRGIKAIPGWDGDGIDGEVISLPAPGALLDNAGQVLGLWVSLALEDRRTVLPTTIDRIAFHRPKPPVGSRVHCRADITAVEVDRVVADLELVGPDGPWAVIEGWVERRFDTTNRVFDVIRSPQDHLVSEITEHGWAWAQETWLDPASREMIMRRYLNSAEREHYGARNPRAQRATLVGRVAVKDILRYQHWSKGGGPVFPAEITVTNELDGRPSAHGVAHPGTFVSIAHSNGVGVAMAERSCPVGIDIEVIAPRSPYFESTVLAEGERDVLAAMAGSLDERLTTIWTLKEAAAKARGSGLGGRPKDFVIVERDGSRYRIGDRWLCTDRLVLPSVPDHLERMEYIVAWTLPD